MEWVGTITRAGIAVMRDWIRWPRRGKISRQKAITLNHVQNLGSGLGHLLRARCPYVLDVYVIVAPTEGLCYV